MRPIVLLIIGVSCSGAGVSAAEGVCVGRSVEGCVAAAPSEENSARGSVLVQRNALREHRAGAIDQHRAHGGLVAGAVSEIAQFKNKHRLDNQAVSDAAKTRLAHRASQLTKYDLVNRSSAFSAQQVQEFLGRYQVKHKPGTSSDGMYTDDACWVVEHPPNSSENVMTLCGKDEIHNLGSAYPDLTNSVVGTVVAAGKTLSFSECTTGTEAEGMPSGGRACDTSLTLTSVDGLLKIENGVNSNFQTPCPGAALTQAASSQVKATIDASMDIENSVQMESDAHVSEGSDASTEVSPSRVTT